MSSLEAPDLLPVIGGPFAGRRHPAPLERVGLREDDQPLAVLKGLFEAFDRAGIRYCLLHGYPSLSQGLSSDIDALIDPKISSDELLQLVQSVCVVFGAEIARTHAYHIVVTGRRADGSRFFLSLDFCIDASLGNLQFYAAEDVLMSRRRRDGVWIPAAHIGFAAYLARTIAGRKLDERRSGIIASLFREDPRRCKDQLHRFWSTEDADLLAVSAGSGDWSAVLGRMDGLRQRLLWRIFSGAPLRYLGAALRKTGTRLLRVLRPDGVSVVLLGPDGAGKSSVEGELISTLSQIFPQIECYGFAPNWIQSLLHGSDRRTETPHALEPRSPAFSVARAVLYWLPTNLLICVAQRLELARGALVINDRHFVDALVDQQRYRYGGPVWLLRAIWRVLPKPDLVILLDGNPDVLHARKPELSLQELAKLRARYLQLVRGLTNGEVVDVERPLPQIVDEVAELILGARARPRSRPAVSVLIKPSITGASPE